MNERDELISEALTVLDQNWLGESTRPAPRLYPHQWSWDSAFIAIGNAGRNSARATRELDALFRGQWSNGMVPHIVFGPTDDHYFPSASFWQSRLSPDAPSMDTSGICQPPVHALAVGAVVRRLDDGRPFLAGIFDRLCAWHDYLFEERTIAGGLAEIWHPWESGMDNSPAWDDLMANLHPRADEIPAYERVDTAVVDAADRPTGWEYDRYAYLAAFLRDQNYAPTDPAAIPFRAHDVLFNSLLARSEVEIAGLAGLVGADPTLHVDRAAALGDTIHRRLWDESLGMHASLDVRTAQRIPVQIAGGFAALLAAPPPQMTTTIVQTLSDILVPLSDRAVALPTVPVTDPGFEPTRYWRGPAWINLMWLTAHGLDEVGEPTLARRLRNGITTLVRAGGFHEYFDPTTGTGHGSSDFSWTAALSIAATDELADSA